MPKARIQMNAGEGLLLAQTEIETSINDRPLLVLSRLTEVDETTAANRSKETTAFAMVTGGNSLVAEIEQPPNYPILVSIKAVSIKLLHMLDKKNLHSPSRLIESL